MKRLWALFLLLLLNLSLIACTNKDGFTIKDIEVIYQESKEVVVLFNKDHHLKVDYTFEGNAISFAGNVVSGLIYNTKTVVTAKHKNLMTTFIVSVVLSPEDDYYKYETYEIKEDEVGILKYIGIKITGKLQLPTYIAGKKVVAIADNAFADNQENLKDVTSIIIPKHVKNIGKKAFYNNDKITNITFENDSELLEIGMLAFAKTPNLKSFTIPSNLNYIDELAFQDSGIINFVIINNPNYIWENNFLIDKNVSDGSSFIAIYANPKVSDFVVPDSVKILGAFLFNNNKNIKSIDLNKVTFISYRAFTDSSLEIVIGGKFVELDSADVFLNTPWINNQK